MNTKVSVLHLALKVACGCLVGIGLGLVWAIETRPTEALDDSGLQEKSVPNARSYVTANAEHLEAGLPPSTESVGHAARQDESIDVLRARLAIATGAAEKGTLAEALIKVGSEEAIRVWGQTVLTESDPGTIRAMMSALDNLIGEPGLEMVTELVELSDRPEVFEGLARTVSRMANSRTPQHLAEIYSQPAAVAGQRDRALRLLGTISNPEAVPGLVRLLYQRDLGTDVSEQASVSLGKIGNPASVIALTGAFNALPEESFAERQLVIKALASVSNPESALLLEDLAANSPQPLIAAAAKDALQRIAPGEQQPTQESHTWMPPPKYLIGTSSR